MMLYLNQFRFVLQYIIKTDICDEKNLCIKFFHCCLLITVTVLFFESCETF